jgi:hypothetical protein
MPTIKKVRNWNEYNRNLEKRGEIIFHIEEEYGKKLYYQGDQKRGGLRKYTKEMYEMILIVSTLLKFPLRASVGFVKGLLYKLNGKECEVPNFGHASRMIKELDLNIKSYTRKTDNISLCFDSTGVSIHDTSGWHQRKHGGKDKSPNERWKKVHITTDLNTGQILSMEVTESNVNDCEVVDKMMNNLNCDKKNIKEILGDGAYDLYDLYKKGFEIGAKVIVPPDTTSKAQDELKKGRKKLEYLKQRDETIKFIRQYENFELGRKKWKEISGYHQRSKIEATMFRWKRTHGFGVRYRSKESMKNEAIVKVNILNKMIDIGRAMYY